MEALPYRATVFLRPGGPRGTEEDDGDGPAELIERRFARERDAVEWCRVMTEAQPGATGIWLVARLARGRSLELTRENGVLTRLDPEPAEEPEEMEPVLLQAAFDAHRKRVGVRASA
jgi:hypothetical protein